MKKHLLSITAILLLSATFMSCSKLTDKLFKAFDTKQIEGDFSTAILTNTSALSDLGTANIPFDIEAEIKTATGGTFGLDNAPKVTIKSITITILNPDANNNFANFETALMKFNTNSNFTPIGVGTDATIPDTYAVTRTFVVNNTMDIKSYLKGAKTLGYIYNAKLRRATTKALNFRVVAQLTIG